MSLKRRLAAGELLVGTWIKTPSPIVVEVLCLSSLDLLVLDAEHAPFDRLAIDAGAMAARAGAKELLVRVPSAAPEHILNALDCGASGVVVPHVRSAAEAETVARAAGYGPGGARGYAGSSRAAGYGTVAMPAHLRASAERAVVVAQVEDWEAIDAIDEIAAVPGVDALFVGRVDLTVAAGAESQDDPRVVDAVERVCAAGRAAGRPVGMFLGRTEDAAYWRARGATLFLLGSDHGFLLNGAEALGKAVRG